MVIAVGLGPDSEVCCRDPKICNVFMCLIYVHVMFPNN